MTRVFVDASSAILLYRANLFDQAAEVFSLVFAPEVFKEVHRDNYPGARFFQEAAESGRIRVARRDPVELSTVSLQGFPALDRGEQETIAFYLVASPKTDAFVLIDDGQGARFCARHHIPFINALLVPKIFWYSKRMDRTTAQQKMETLTELGRYSSRIIQKARQLTREDLTFFTNGSSSRA